jgi:hypothetical protein
MSMQGQARNRRDTQGTHPTKSPKTLGKGLEMDKRSPHAAGFGWLTRGADRLHGARAGIRHLGKADTKQKGGRR